MYEIAKLKSEDERWQMVDLKDICERVIDEAYNVGVHVSDSVLAPISKWTLLYT